MWALARLQLFLLPLLVVANNPSNGHVQTKHLTTSDGVNYTYDYVPAKSKSTVLFLHGFPSTRRDWQHQVANLSAAGYGVIAPDLLGYGDSDRPLNIKAYNLKRMSQHLMEIVDNEKVKTVVGVGHDWGSTSLSRAINWHPKRFEKAAFLSAGYAPGGEFLDIDGINALSQSSYGYMQFGYWYFFNSYDCAGIMENNLESAFSLVYPRNISAWPENLSNLGAARSWFEANKTTPLPDYITKDHKAEWMSAFGQKNAFATSIVYYQALMQGVQSKDEKALTKEDTMLHVPVLGVGGLKDLVARADEVRGSIKPFAKAGYTIRNLNAGHWLMFEDPQGLNEILLDFLES